MTPKSSSPPSPAGFSERIAVWLVLYSLLTGKRDMFPFAAEHFVLGYIVILSIRAALTVACRFLGCDEPDKKNDDLRLE